MARYEYTGGTSNKFWEVELKGTTVVTRYGRIGSDGQTTSKSFDTRAAARAHHDRQVASKLKKGYEKATTKKATTKKATTKKATTRKAATKKAATKKATTKKATTKKATTKKATTKKKGETDPAHHFRALCLALPRTQARGARSRSSYWVGGGRRHEFATWIADGDQPGAHLRYASSETLSRAGVERCTAHTGKDSNWYYLRELPDEDTLTGLIEISHRVAAQRGAGRTVGSKRDLYRPLLKALAAAPDTLHPTVAVHANGPAAKVLGQEGPCAYALTCWAAELIGHLVPPEQQEERDRLFDMATRAKAPEYSRMWNAAVYPKIENGESPAVRAARMAVGTRGCVAGGYDQRAVSFATTAAEAVVEALLAAGEEETLRAYLVELDERVMKWELVAVASKKGKREREPAVDRVLWRGADDKGYPALWIARLAGGQHALLAKLGRRWSWLEGSLDDVLASVPDQQFEAAAATCAARGG